MENYKYFLLLICLISFPLFGDMKVSLGTHTHGSYNVDVNPLTAFKEVDKAKPGVILYDNKETFKNGVSVIFTNNSTGDQCPQIDIKNSEKADEVKVEVKEGGTMKCDAHPKQTKRKDGSIVVDTE